MELVYNPYEDEFDVKAIDSITDDRITTIENTQIKIAYYAEITTLSGQIIPPSGSTILLDQWSNGVDAIISNIPGGSGTVPDFEDTGYDVISFDINGDYTISGLGSTLTALIYYISVPIKLISTLNQNLIINFVELKVALSAIQEYMDFDTTLANPTYTEGRLFYDTDKNALSYYNENGEVTVNIGQEVLFPVVNNSGATITNGTVVTPDSTGIVLADRHHKELSRLIAVATTTMLDGESGYITRLGQVGGLDTSMYTAGQILYLGNDGEFAIAPPLDGSYTAIVGVVDVIDPIDGVITVDPNVSDLTVEVTDTNGFPLDQKNATLILPLVGDRLMSIVHTTPGEHFHFYERGDKYESTGDAVTWSDLEGEHWFYYKDGVFTYKFEPTLSEKISVILNNAFVTSIYWDATNKVIIGDVQDERHGIGMAPQTHLYLHLTNGAQWVGGYALGDFDIDGDGDLASSAQFSVAPGVFFDEDIEHSESGLPVTSSIPIIYNEGTEGNPRQVTQTGFAINGQANVGVYYNEWTGTTWQRTLVPHRDACCYHLFSFNGQDVNTISVMGQAVYPSVAAARDGASTEISSIQSKLPFAEMIPLGTIVVESRNTYANAVGGRIRSIDGENYISWTSTELSRGSAPTSHSNLTNVETAAIGVSQGHVDNTKPFQYPTLTTVERDLFPLTNGTAIYNTTINKVEFCENGVWVIK